MWLINNRNISLSFWKLDVRDEDMSMVRLLLVHYWLSVAVSSHDREQREWWKQDLSCLYKGTNPIYSRISLRHNHLPKSPHSNTITLGTRISTYKFWANTNIQSIAIILVFLGQS